MLELETSLRCYSKKINYIGRIIGSNITYGENEKMDGKLVHLVFFLLKIWKKKNQVFYLKKKKRKI